MFFRTAANKRQRRGTAPLEFVLVMPFLVILGGMIFTMARANMARADTILEARNQVWHDRYNARKGSELSLSDSAAAEKMAGLTESGSAFSGQRSGSATKSARVQQLAGPGQFFIFGAIQAESRHEVFSNPWDHESIPFTGQLPLALDRRAAIYALRVGLLGSLADGAQLFATLMGAIQPPSSAAESWKKVQDALTTISNKLNELDQSIKMVEQEVEMLQDKLIEATEAAVKGELKKQIEKLKEKLKNMQESKKQLNEGKNLAPQPPASGAMP